MYLKDIRFSIWADFIERDFLDNEFKELIEKNIVNGATSNPAIFKNAILNSSAYKEQLKKLSDKTPKEKYEALAIYDIKKAADILEPLYKKNDDGFVSIEVDPHFANDTEKTIKEAKKLWNEIDRKNLMIKVPATDEGCEAIKELVKDGININATLIFDPKYAQKCLDAIEEGLKNSKENPNIVLSIFVSRFDRKLDKILEEKGIEKGKVGILNAAKIYNIIQKRALPNVRALFASTGVKGDDYPPYYYISELIAPNSINTAPIETIKSFVKYGKKDVKLPIMEEEIDNFFENLKNSGIDMQKVYDELLKDGLVAFKDAFDEIMKELE
ncbi:transaldolase [Nitrosophilus kaiyonis]|uniref:transaldolase n=1 Tax=Nitrosophilus kaiyonis TaxID=2930200 RepID=UPI00248F9F9C|nr:transaldolase [Nitrosophilus kaiyonis]